MNVIAKISCYNERGVVTLKSRKEYLNSVTHTTSVLLRIKNWTVWYIECYSMSTYTGVTNCQKTVRFFWPTLYMSVHLIQMSIIFTMSYIHCLRCILTWGTSTFIYKMGVSLEHKCSFGLMSFQTPAKTGTHVRDNQVWVIITLTPSMPSVPNCCCSKGSAPYCSNPLFLIFDIRALCPERQSAQMSEI